MAGSQSRPTALRHLRRHLMPVLFLTGASVLLGAVALRSFGASTPTYLGPYLDLALAVLYVILAAAYEWVLWRGAKNRRIYEEQKQALAEWRDDIE